ncbi:predicted protein [Nematostella vectensis]|uniref:G-protein coupled receptors family 1 profile domain-containing protein n=1 Tax=Nematostella vectensis TaxID=45351 RepID=A7SX59_NEMVE|nr:G-protein coupled receptor 26 [Nematostella vectensis]EDO31716.1 predicted protein [Nematostella vectensis]|eukprot:XP_001623816.1 predicted protein [Nematostella vectensis]
MGPLSETEVFGFSLCLFFMTLAAVVMNFLVCLVVYRSKELRRHISSVFIVNLAVCDFMMSIFAMPYSFGAVVVNHWPFGNFWCQTTGFWNLVLSLAAVLTLATISIDRYIAVIKPLQYRAKMTLQWALVMIVFVWIQATVFAIAPIGLGWYEFNSHYFFCTFPSELQTVEYIAFKVLTYTANVGVSLLILLSTYYKIFGVAKLHSRRIGHAVISTVHFAPGVRGAMSTESSRQREFKAARKILFVIGAFVCCVAPYTTIRLIELVKGYQPLSHRLTIAFSWVAYLKSAIDPFIYGLLQRRFRRALFELFVGPQRARMARNSLPCGPIRLSVRAKRQSSQSETWTAGLNIVKSSSLDS